MTNTATTQTTQTIKITKAYFDLPTGDRERIEGTYNVLVDGVDVGQVARDEWVTAGYWGAWKAGRGGFEKRGQAVAYLVKRYNNRLADEAAEAAEKATEAQETTSLFPASMPSNFAMFTTPGNAAVAKGVREALRGRSDFFSDHDMVVRATETIQATVSARKGMEEAQDTAVGDAIYCVLSGETSAQLGID